ncbi:MAG TPA: hypothetical protein VK083_05075 [Nocardia sp.]|uniref:hypothetical protein n=1 Tax=Nocardia TaxID=1817 RepID=UPI0024587A61|nr:MULTISPECIES: hypothetical protein [Nocardia]HLS76145.1 hypothetical protein [Nocardia sp.]
MHARSSTIAAQASSIDKGIACLRRQVLPEMSALDGWVGLSLMLERSTGRCIATSAWESEEAMHACDTHVRPLRNSLSAALDGRTQKIEEWEVAVMHRDHLAGERACTRCVWLQTDPAGIDRVIDTFKSYSLPELEKVEGFRSASLFVNRATGRAVGSSVWSSIEELEGSRDAAARMRPKAAEQMRADIIEVAEFRLAFAHLRVPELV